MDISVYDAKVRAGAKVLDAYFGKQDWRSDIDLARLEMDDARFCILGQLFVNYFDGIARLTQKFDYFTVEARRGMGFTAKYSDEFAWIGLERAWKRYLGGSEDE